MVLLLQHCVILMGKNVLPIHYCTIQLKTIFLFENVSIKSNFLSHFTFDIMHEVWKPLQEMTYQILRMRLLKTKVIPCQENHD